MTQKINQGQLFAADATFNDDVTLSDVVLPAANNAGGSAVSSDAAVAVTFERARLIRHSRFTITDLSITVLEANGYGGAEIIDFADANLIILGAETDLAITKDGTGYIAATDLDVSLGTTTASATDLTDPATQSNIIAKADLNDNALAVAFDAHSASNGTPALLFVADAATNKVFLNVAAATETGEDASISVSGTVDLFWVDLGNVTS